jgi:hypothetical protein
MQLTIDVKNSAVDKILYFLEHLKEDVTIISRSPEVDETNLDIEVIEEDDPDYSYVREARARREKGEKSYSVDEVMREFE